MKQILIILATAIFILISSLFLGGCTPNPAMTNDEIIREGKKCLDAGMTFYQKVNFENDISGLFCIAKQ